ncbi:MAG: hypothetical protein ABIT08_09690 [Bacteroidia bacterium]
MHVKHHFRLRRILILSFLITFSTKVLAQDNVLTAGFQIKPIFSGTFFKTGPQTLAGDSGVSFTTKPGSGFCAGMIVRYGITNRVSIESGINYVKRKYDLTIQDSTLFTGTSDYRIIGYEIPLSGLVFIQLGEKVFMDVSLGMSFDFFPTDVQSGDDYFFQLGERKSWIGESVIANLGYEYRTEKSGYFYIGASYHRPFNDIYYSTVNYYRNKDDYTSGQQFLLAGNYLTIDFRYFFHEDPLKKQNKKRQ